MILLGAEVRWREDINKSPWRGKVTGYKAPNMVEIDGRGWYVSEGLLEVMSTEQEETIDALEELVAEQCELIDQNRQKREEAEAELANLRDKAFELVKALTGSYRPSPQDCLRFAGGQELLALSDALGG